MNAMMMITPYDAMWREVGCLYRALEQSRAELEKAAAGAGANDAATAALVVACAAAEATWLHQRWRKEEPPASWQPFLSGTAPASASAAVAWLREVREASRLALMKATDADLDRRTIAADGGPASLRWVLFQLLDGAGFARGQIAALRGARS
jgi:Protein of unknown function (DUF664)